MTTRPPDLEMRVRTTAEQGKTRLSFTLHSPTGAVGFSHREIAGPLLQGSPEDYQRYSLSKLQKLGERLDVDRSLALRADIERKLANLGRDLWRELFPSELRAAYREIRRSVRSWIIVTDEPWIPWELIRPYDDSRPDEIIDDEFLALRFELTRWFSGERPLVQKIVIRHMAVLCTAPELPNAERERSLFSTLCQRLPEVSETAPLFNSIDDVLDFLASTGAGLLHFIGHGTQKSPHPDEAGLPLPDGRVFRPVDLDGSLATHLGQTRPLVFLNACWAGRQGWSLTRLGGWADRWIVVCGAGAFVAPMWPVRDQIALDFARTFYGALADGATLGKAALAARSFVHRERPGDPSVLAYTVFGHPNAQVLFGERSAEETPEKQDRPTASLSGPLWVPPASRKQSYPPRMWSAAAFAGLLILLFLTAGRQDLGTPENLSQTRTAGGVTPVKVDNQVAAQPASSSPEISEEKPPATSPPIPEPATSRRREATSVAVRGLDFRITGDRNVRSALSSALRRAAEPLVEAGVSGWTLTVEVDPPRITPTMQDGFAWETCNLTAQASARGAKSNLDLGLVSGVRSQVDGQQACLAAAEPMAEAALSRLVSALRKEGEL